MGLVTPDGGLEHYDGKIRFVDATGTIVADQLSTQKFQEYIGEAVEPWTYLKFPYYKPLGYPGGMYRVGPLARLNVASHCGTPLADRELAEFRQLGRGAVLSSFHYHYARLIEILYCVERIEEILAHPDLLTPQVLAFARRNRYEGVGCSEAPRGTLFHHYKVKQGGLISWANLIIATGQNNLAMNQTVLQIARHYVKGDKLKEGMLNRVEAGIRAYDPCLSCSTHAYGEMPLRVELVAADGTVLDTVGRRVATCPHRLPRLRPRHRLGQPAARGRRRRLARPRGPALAQAAPGRCPPMKLRHAHQLAPEMAECVSKAQGVVFIDARRDGHAGRGALRGDRPERRIEPPRPLAEPAGAPPLRRAALRPRASSRRPQHRRRALRHGRGALPRRPPRPPAGHPHRRPPGEGLGPAEPGDGPAVATGRIAGSPAKRAAKREAKTSTSTACRGSRSAILERVGASGVRPVRPHRRLPHRAARPDPPDDGPPAAARLARAQPARGAGRPRQPRRLPHGRAHGGHGHPGAGQREREDHTGPGRPAGGRRGRRPLLCTAGPALGASGALRFHTRGEILTLRGPAATGGPRAGPEPPLRA